MNELVCVWMPVANPLSSPSKMCFKLGLLKGFFKPSAIMEKILDKYETDGLIFAPFPATKDLLDSFK